jgi:hypothetical protein
MTTPDKSPIWPHVTYKWVEVVVTAALFVLGIFLLWESISLGPGWSPSGPEPGLWPLALTVLYMLGTVGVLIYTIVKPDERPFFEVRQEVLDLVAVGTPVLLSIFLIYWLGIFVTSGLYLAIFMFWYGRFSWYSSLGGGIFLAVLLWFLLRKGFNISMPMSVLYYQNILPF